jgi:hypothetical protein
MRVTSHGRLGVEHYLYSGMDAGGFYVEAALDSTRSCAADGTLCVSSVMSSSIHSFPTQTKAEDFTCKDTGGARHASQEQRVPQWIG